MKYIINYENDVLNLPATVVDKIGDLSEIELKLLCMLSYDKDVRDNYDELKEKLSKMLSTTEEELDKALSFLRGAGLVSEDKGKKKKPSRKNAIPSYSGKELSTIIEEAGLSDILDECQRLTGKMYNPTEINKIAALNSYLGLDSEYILLLFTYCVSKGKKSLNQIEKMAYDLSDMNITTVDKLEVYIKKEEERVKLENVLRRKFGWGDRELTPKEKGYIKTWIFDYNYGEDMISKAYNISIDTNNKFSIPYIDGILKNWYNKGLKTPIDVDIAQDKYEKEKIKSQAKGGSENNSFSVDEFFEIALKRSSEKVKND